MALAKGAGDDIERRAWHRAAAALGPDEEAAAELEAAGGIALARTATIAAAAAFERAAALGDGGNVRGRRLYLAAAAAIAGDFPRGVDLCSRALADVTDSSLEFAIRLLRGQMLFVSNGAVARRMLLEEVAALERKNPRGAATLAALAAIDSARTRDARAAREDAERLERLSAQIGDDWFVTVVRGYALFFAGRVAEAMPLLAQGRKLVQADSFGCGPAGYTEQVIYITGLEALLAAGLDEEARAAAARRMAQTEAKGGLAHLACSGCYPPRCAFYAGEWTAAASEFARMLTIAEETHQPRYQWFAHAFLAQIAAARGDAVGCRAHSDAADACRDATPQLIGVTLGAGATGLLALSRGDCLTAVDIYEREVLPRAGQLLLWQEIADAAEAYARADRRSAAEKVLADFRGAGNGIRPRMGARGRSARARRPRG